MVEMYKIMELTFHHKCKSEKIKYCLKNDQISLKTNFELLPIFKSTFLEKSKVISNSLNSCL